MLGKVFNGSTLLLNREFDFQEIEHAIDLCKNGKSYLQVPNDALKNPNANILLYNFSTSVSITSSLSLDLVIRWILLLGMSIFQNQQQGLLV